MNLLTNARDALNEKYPGHDENKTIIISATEMMMSLVNGHLSLGAGAPSLVMGQESLGRTADTHDPSPMTLTPNPRQR